MLKNDPPERERKLADQALLRALLCRSSYSSAGLGAQSGGNYAREIAIIDHLRKGMVMSDMHVAVWEKVAFSHAAALLRWEGEGGSPSGRDQTVASEKRGI
ncbi:hypothetical protein G6N76_19955 [Rhizobium daejeonense]|uniref:Uncharacterized protein n=1 Tax=Rhizobium daejeonense TaxID=240521 RepID=A0A6M1SCH7_9HYPH|nr:hypothetical protein [Rhizobium daejeonense]NGO65948.1 hypothetical protein [Rhizobium daejeonense]